MCVCVITYFLDFIHIFSTSGVFILGNNFHCLLHFNYLHIGLGEAWYPPPYIVDVYRQLDKPKLVHASMGMHMHQKCIVSTSYQANLTKFLTSIF